LYRGDSLPPDAPTLSSVVPNHQEVTATVARSGTKIATSYKIDTVEDPSKFCLVTGTAPASGNTTSTGGGCTITGLTNGTAYTLRAIAYNVEDASSATVAPASVTPVRMAPTLTSVTNTAAGNTIVLTYDSTLSQTPTLTTSMFTVRDAGVARTINSVAVSGNSVTLTLASSVQKYAAVTVAYVAPTPDDAATNVAIQNTGGIDAESLSEAQLQPNSYCQRSIGNPYI
jgi:uncharacterized repeat protein (TIGR02059 family)